MSEPKRKNTDESDQDEKGQLKLKSQVTTNSACEITPEILPPEIWEQIFKHVWSPKDLLSCWNATSVWRCALRSTEFYFKMTLPYVLPFLGKQDLLQCSAVSKSWNAVVDACIYEAEDFESDYSLDQEQRIVLKLDSSDLTDFNENLYTNNEFGDKITGVNLVAFRHVDVTLEFDTSMWWGQLEAERRMDPLSFDCKNLLKCLAHHGHLIRNLELELNGENVTTLDKLKLIQRCLTLTPNLRVLSISDPPPEFANEDSDSDDENDERQLAAFNAYISENPWPKLEQLKVLKFNDNTDGLGYVGIANAYAPQLVCLKFGFYLDEPHEPLTNRFSCLQKIVYLFSESDSAKEFATFVQAIKSPLKQLTIVFDYPNLNVEDATCLTIAANAASATLETLVLHTVRKYIGGGNFDDTKFEDLRLPKLKELVMVEFGYPSFEFLENVCPRLEHLTVTPWLPQTVLWHWKLREFTETYGELYSEHQFWNKFANLASVDVTYMFYPKYVKREGSQLTKKMKGGTARKVYTRSGYETKVEKDREMRIESSSSDEEIMSMTRSMQVYKPN